MANPIKSKWTPLFLSNFLGVYTDNLLKNSVIFISVTWMLPTWLNQSQLISIVSASLIIPYLFLSPIGGRLAVKHSKKKVFRFFKLLELPVMLAACIAFYFHWGLLAVITVLLMGILSCLYSPSKYSLIRDIGGEEGVSFGSGVFETMAFLGVLIGTITASVISDIQNKWLIFALFIGHLNPIRFLFDAYRFASQYSLVNSAVLGAASFWLIGGMLQMNLVIHTKHVYGASNTTTGVVMAIAAVGIALGTWASGKISGKEVRKSLILIGIIGMTVFFLTLTFLKLNFNFYCAAVFIVAFLGGIFQVPNLSIIQQARLGRKLGDMIAYLNLVTFIFVLIGTFLFWLTTYVTGENSFAVFGVIAIVCVLVTIYFIRKSPVFYQDILNWGKKKK